MRTLFLALAAAGAAVAFSGAPAVAQQLERYSWCAQYDEAGTNCGFTSFSQCNEAISGNGGWCDRNLLAAPMANPAGITRAQRRHIRNQAGAS